MDLPPATIFNFSSKEACPVPESRDKWRGFFLAFSITLLLLSLMMVLTVMAVQPTMPQANNASSRQEYVYRPVASDSLTMVVIGLGESGASDFLLIRFNPQYGQVPLVLLPANTAVTRQGTGMTLLQAYEQGGGNAVKEALSERLGIVIDRYAALNREIFIRIADQTGNVLFDLPQPIIYERPDGYSVNLPTGQRRLDGQDIADIFACPSFEDGQLGRARILGNLVAAIINQNLDAASDAFSSSLFKLAVNLVDTDVTSADYELRRQAADFVSRLDAQVAGNLAPSGTFLSQGEVFELSEEYVSMLRKYFQMVS